jgi:uncharacterized membrane protein YphA (DoxX/SURF4 family)
MFQFTRSIFISILAYRLVRWSLAVIFVYAGAMKLTATQSFTLIIDAYGLLPPLWVDYIAIGLPAIEIIAALALFFDLRGSLTVIAALLIFFIIILTYGAWMGFDLNCGCFKFGDSSVATKGSLRPALLRDAVMFGAVCYLYFVRSKKPIHPFGFKALLHKALILRR